MGRLTDMRYRLLLRLNQSRRWITLDTAVPLLLVVSLAGSAYTAVNIRRVIEAEAASASAHEDDSRRRDRAQQAALEEVEQLLKAQLAAALKAHDQRTAEALETALRRLERLLNRPDRIVIEREGTRTVVIISPQPAPQQPGPGRGRNP